MGGRFSDENERCEYRNSEPHDYLKICINMHINC
jgi:hypothetical protein